MQGAVYALLHLTLRD